jgi:hypothetical protein
MALTALCLDLMIRDQSVLIKTLSSMAIAHNKMGIVAHQYGIFCEVLIATMEETLGVEDFNSDVKYCWEKALSRMLEVIVPLAIKDGLYVPSPPIDGGYLGSERRKASLCLSSSSNHSNHSGGGTPGSGTATATNTPRRSNIIHNNTNTGTTGIPGTTGTTTLRGRMGSTTATNIRKTSSVRTDSTTASCGNVSLRTTGDGDGGRGGGANACDGTGANAGGASASGSGASDDTGASGT